MEKFHIQTGHGSVQVEKPVEDIIHLRNLRVSAAIGPDAWGRDTPPRTQPIIISLQLYVDTTSAGSSDDIKDTFSYGQMYKDVISKAEGVCFESIDDLAWSLGELFDDWPGKMIKMQVLAPKGSLRAEGGLTKECCWRRSIGNRGTKYTLVSHAWAIRGLKLACIIGVNPHERLERQIVNINLQIVGEIQADAYELQLTESGTAWALLVNQICKVRVLRHTSLIIMYLFSTSKVVEDSSCETLEALCTLVATTALEDFLIPRIGVHVEKPSALLWVEGAGVEIDRDQIWINSR